MTWLGCWFVQRKKLLMKWAKWGPQFYGYPGIGLPPVQKWHWSNVNIAEKFKGASFFPNIWMTLNTFLRCSARKICLSWKSDSFAHCCLLSSVNFKYLKCLTYWRWLFRNIVLDLCLVWTSSDSSETGVFSLDLHQIQTLLNRVCLCLLLPPVLDEAQGKCAGCSCYQ